jgi:ubiquinone/menaquinone biosynthesis C-methylase UbiE
MENRQNVVRGYGPLDMFLAKQRHKMARKKIKSANEAGRILDVGCGNYPLFLLNVNFSEKYGLDKISQSKPDEDIIKQGIALINSNFEEVEKFPFEKDYFNVVTMLAVFEHIIPENLVKIHREIYRVLKRNGIYVMTTPAYWTDYLLRTLAKLRLISDIEIKEHKGRYNHFMISSILQAAGFPENNIQFGYFELFMNLWVTAVK